MTTRHFSRQWTIHFSHCDPAGIVFFPQYLVLFNNLVEAWFTEGLGISYADMIATRRVGLPTVHLECDFRRISKMGEKLDFCLGVKRLGNRSLTLQLWVGEAEQPRVQLEQVLVFTSLETHKSITIPTDIRQTIASFA